MKKSNAAEVIVDSVLMRVLSATLRPVFSCFHRIQTTAPALGSAQVEEESCSGRGKICK